MNPPIWVRPGRILFIFPHRTPYDSQTVREAPSGGTEKAVIFLGEAFRARGYDVLWCTQTAEIAHLDHCWPDMVITQEAQLLERFPQGCFKVWWCHHYPDQPIIQRGAPYGRCFADAVVTLSQAQAQAFQSVHRMPSTVIPHGVWLSEVLAPGRGLKKKPLRLIYASTPFRGLAEAAALFESLWKTGAPGVSQLEWVVCSSMATYGDVAGDLDYAPLFESLRAMPNVTLKGALGQAALYRELALASVFFYPCTWPETYCLVLDEAKAHGCTPLVSEVGCLAERAEPLSTEAMTAWLLAYCQSGGVMPSSLADRQPVVDWDTVATLWETLWENDSHAETRPG